MPLAGLLTHPKMTGKVTECAPTVTCVPRSVIGFYRTQMGIIPLDQKCIMATFLLIRAFSRSESYTSPKPAHEYPTQDLVRSNRAVVVSHVAEVY
jgi:hypothetical protein